MAKMKYDNIYIRFEFTSLNDNRVEKGQCFDCSH